MPARFLDRPEPGLAGPMTGQSFGDWLSAIMTSRGLTNAELGRRINVDGSLVSKWKRNFQRPDTWSCQLLSEALGIPVGEVMVHAGHADPTAPLNDPVKTRAKELIDALPSDEVEPYIAVFERRLGLLP